MSDIARKVGQASVLICSAIACFALLFVALQRVSYRYELEWLESGLVEHVRRLSNGMSIYGAPAVDFVAFPYPPLYVFAAYVVSWAVGDGFLALRLVSLVSTVAILVLLFLLVRMETKRWWCGLAAAGLYAATYGYTGTWFEVGKADSMFLALALAGLYVVRQAESRRQYLFAGVLFGLAALTKQTALIIAGPIVAYALITRFRPALILPVSTAVVVVVPSAVLHFLSQGWSTYFIWEQLLQHEAISSGRFLFWTEDVATFLPTLLLMGLAAALGLNQKRRWELGLYGAGAVGTLAATWASRLHEGGFDNVLMPLCVLAAIAFGCSLRTVVEHPNWKIVAVATAIAAWQFQSLIYSPTAALPTDADRRAGDDLIALLAGFDEDVLVAAHPTYSVYAGKSSHAQQGGVHDVLRSDNEEAKQKLRRSYEETIRSKRFSAIVLDRDYDAEVFPSDWKDFYRQVPFTVIPDGDLRPAASNSDAPSQLWVRR